MAGSGPYRAGSHQPEPARTEQQGNFPNLERDRNKENGRFREGSVNTTQTSRSQSRVGSHISQRQDNKQAMQREINDLKKKLRHARLTMTTIGKDREPPQARLSLIWKSITRGANAEAHLLRAWDTMP